MRLPSSNLATVMHLLKGNIGTGILAMPYAVSNAGLAVGTLFIPILGVIAIHCMLLLVKCSKIVAERVDLTTLDYAGTMEQVFAQGPEPLRRFAPAARVAANTMLVLTQCGFCCVYFLFVAQSIDEVVKNLSGEDYMDFRYYMAITVPLMVVFNFIRTLDKLTRVSSVANVLQMTALCLVFYCLARDLGNIDEIPAVADVSKFPLFFGTAMYAFEGIGVVLPLENDMRTPEDFRGLTGVLNTAMVIVVCLFTGIGFYGYLDYGDNVKGSITFNLDFPYLSEVIRILFAVAIFLTYPLQMYVALKITWPYVNSKFHLESYSARKQLVINLVYRSLMVLITFLLAATIPYLNLMIALIGALASSSLALIFPSMMEQIVLWNSGISKTSFYLTLVKNILIFLIGVVGGILGTYVSVVEIIKCSKDPALCPT